MMMGGPRGLDKEGNTRRVRAEETRGMRRCDRANLRLAVVAEVLTPNLDYNIDFHPTGRGSEIL